MKKILIILAIGILMIGAASAQTITADITARGGSISTFGAALSVPLTPVTYMLNDNTGLGGAATGTVSIQTGSIGSGDFQNTSSYASGGTVTISATDAYDSVSFSGVVTSATWSATRAANGTYTYTLSGNIQDSTTSQTGAFVLTTVSTPVANLKFQGSVLINYISIHLN